MPTYIELLRDPRWQKKRLLILERDGWQCRSCGDETKTLNVHHKFYRRGAKPWEYEDDDLVTLCEDCHTWVERERGLLRDALISFPDEALPRLRGFVEAYTILSSGESGRLFTPDSWEHAIGASIALGMPEPEFRALACDPSDPNIGRPVDLRAIFHASIRATED